MSDALPYILAVGFVLLAVSVIALASKLQTLKQFTQQQLKSLQDEQDSSLKQAVKRQQQNLNIIEQENLEQHRLIQQMDSTIDELQRNINGLQQQLQELQQRDPEVKLYQQAKQLIASGTSIDEVVEACGIPRAEAELLFSLNQQ